MEESNNFIKYSDLYVDDTYEYLAGIFPDADPHYLRSTAEKFGTDSDVKNFVEDKLKSHDYPTREQQRAKIKVTEEQQRYTTNFTVEHFLTKFPDPFKHFEDPNRKCNYNVTVIEFLKSEFSRVKVNTINRFYRTRKFNMSLAVKDLRLTREFNKIARRPREIPTANIQLLQEIAFVRHHAVIRKHFDYIKHKEAEEFNSLKATGGLWTCECCYDDECMPSKCSTCDNAHVFCNSCIVAGTDSKLGNGETRVPCFLDCGGEFSISTLQKVLPPTKFNILLKKRQAAEVMEAGLEGLVSCPFCDFASIPPEGEKVFKCLNPECMKESCIQCKEPNHVPFKCTELQVKEKARKYIEEKMTQALTRTCYKCKKTFYKEDGCNQMTCTCGAKMCYICNKPVKGHDPNHFSDKPNVKGKCPLWTNDKCLNAETVRKVDEEARKELLQQNIHVDTTRLVPAIPPPIPGTHRNKTNTRTEQLANTLAARVLNAGRFNLQEQVNPINRKRKHDDDDSNSDGNNSQEQVNPSKRKHDDTDSI